MTKPVTPVEESNVNDTVDSTTSTPKYSAEELLTIFDEILFSGEYQEDITIKGKLKVTFRSRTALETTDISKELDSKTFNLMITLQQERSFLHIAYSLVSYAGKDLSTLSIEERKAFVGKLPSAVVALLSDTLVVFDEKINLACTEGEQNF